MSAQLCTTQAVVLSQENLSAYSAWVNQVAMLSPEEEKSLAQAWQERGDVEAARRLVLAHLRFVVCIARQYRGYGLDEVDLIQEGNIGLMKAVKRFDCRLGARLATFAAYWIKAEIKEFIIKNWRIVRIATTKAQRKLFFKAKKLYGLTRAEAASFADTLKVTVKDVFDMQKRLFNTVPQSLDQPALHAEDNKEAYLIDTIADDASSPEEDLLNEAEAKKSKLAAALQQLDARSAEILQKRWLTEDKKATFQVLAKSYGISAERVRQIEHNALQKLKTLLGTECEFLS
jgi:RNA polymerase sigma-32 factor